MAVGRMSPDIPWQPSQEWRPMPRQVPSGGPTAQSTQSAAPAPSIHPTVTTALPGTTACNCLQAKCGGDLACLGKDHCQEHQVRSHAQLLLGEAVDTAKEAQGKSGLCLSTSVADCPL